MSQPLGDAAVAAARDATRRIVGAVIPGADAASALADTAVAARRWMSDRHNWIRVGWFTSGVILMFLGAGMLARPALSTVDKAAAPVAKAVLK